MSIFIWPIYQFCYLILNGHWGKHYSMSAMWGKSSYNQRLENGDCFFKISAWRYSYILIVIYIHIYTHTHVIRLWFLFRFKRLVVVSWSYSLIAFILWKSIVLKIYMYLKKKGYMYVLKFTTGTLIYLGNLKYTCTGHVCIKLISCHGIFIQVSIQTVTLQRRVRIKKNKNGIITPKQGPECSWQNM